MYLQDNIAQELLENLLGLKTEGPCKELEHCDEDLRENEFEYRKF